MSHGNTIRKMSNYWVFNLKGVMVIGVIILFLSVAVQPVIIADDSIIVTPAVRHTATDVLGWQTLFGDSSATYYARAWCLPYIVMQSGETIPEDLE